MRLALAALLVCSVACSDTYVNAGTSPTVLPGTGVGGTPVPVPVATRIEFRAVGTPAQARLRYSSPADGLVQIVSTLPYVASFTTAEPSLFLSLEGTPTVTSFSLFPFFSVEIVVNGVMFRQATSTDPFINTIQVAGTWRR